MTTLVATAIEYYSQRDEENFFAWLNSIPSVGQVKGIGHDLMIEIKTDPDDAALRELIALFYRYSIESKQLAAFVTAANEHWFRDEKNYWYHDIF